jgi:hypothetical protein
MLHWKERLEKSRKIKRKKRKKRKNAFFRKFNGISPGKIILRIGEIRFVFQWSMSRRLMASLEIFQQPDAVTPQSIRR